ncbi:hypothetical protein ES703_90252 [subsurface metagenome]
MSFKPYITLLFLVSVLTILLVISFLFPEEDIPLGDDLKVRFATPEEIFTSNEETYVDISDKISNALINDSILEDLVALNVNQNWDTTRANADSLKTSIARFKFPNNNRKILYPVFKAFDNAYTSDKPVRIMHYGDSQIEGDRITSFLRNRLQKKFGGTGVVLWYLSELL